MKYNLVIGMGEVGNGLFTILQTKYPVECRDKEAVVIGHKIDILHISIPYSDKFSEQVAAYIKLYNPGITIIYSSVPIGTSEKLGAVHSPIEGKHPAIGLSIKNSSRWLGSTNKKKLDEAAKFWEKIVPTRKLPSASFTEALKLLSTTEYGLNIEFARYKKLVADELGMDYVAMKQWNLDYNNLYQRLGRTDYQKYILDPPTGPKGGHCVTPNAKLLFDQYPHDLVKIVGEI